LLRIVSRAIELGATRHEIVMTLAKTLARGGGRVPPRLGVTRLTLTVRRLR